MVSQGWDHLLAQMPNGRNIRTCQYVILSSTARGHRLPSLPSLAWPAQFCKRFLKTWRVQDNFMLKRLADNMRPDHCMFVHCWEKLSNSTSSHHKSMLTLAFSTHFVLYKCVTITLYCYVLCIIWLVLFIACLIEVSNCINLAKKPSIIVIASHNLFEDECKTLKVFSFLWQLVHTNYHRKLKTLRALIVP